MFRHLKMFLYRERLIVYLPNVYYCPSKCDKDPVGTTLLRHHICAVVLAINLVFLQKSLKHKI